MNRDMLKKAVAVLLVVIVLCFFASCKKQVQKTRPAEKAALQVEDYMAGLTAEKTAHLKTQTGLLLHPLKDVVELYGTDYELLWEEDYVTLSFQQEHCAFQVYVGGFYDDWETPQVDVVSCNAMEYLAYMPVQSVIFNGTGVVLTDGITIGMSADEIAQKLNASAIVYDASNTLVTAEYDDQGNELEVYCIYGQISDLEYSVVFKGDILTSVRLCNYGRYITAEGNLDCAQQLREAFSFVNDNALANLDPDDLTYMGQVYSSHFDSWFYSWQFTKGDYAGYEVNVEQTEPYRIYIASGAEVLPLLFWCDGKYVEPVCSFLGKWRDFDRKNYIEIKSISKEGIVLFDMYTDDDGELFLLENLSTAINHLPQTLKDYLDAAYMDQALEGDAQFFDGEHQSGAYGYAGDKIYLIDSLVLDFNGAVQYLPKGLGGRIASGRLPIHIPCTDRVYTQPSIGGHMESFGRDDPSEANILASNNPGGAAVINQYLNNIHETTDLKYTAP